jgi:monoamine oxidase
MSDLELKDKTLAEIRTMFGDNAPAPTAVLRTRWHDDPYSGMSYSYPRVEDMPKAIAALAAPVSGRLFFAGEATDQKWYSFVHGAYLSGIRAANEL